MWSEFKPTVDERPHDLKLRNQAWRLTGVLLRDFYYWLAGQASSPSDWESVPPWAERLPSDISFVMGSLRERPDDGMVDIIDQSIRRVSTLLEQLDNAPVHHQALNAVTKYTEHRKRHAGK